MEDVSLGQGPRPVTSFRVEFSLNLPLATRSRVRMVVTRGFVRDAKSNSVCPVTGTEASLYSI